MIAGPIPEHVLAPPPPRSLAWAAAAFGRDARIVRVEPLTDSRWLANHVVEIETGDGLRHRAILRRWARPGWERLDPDFGAAREAAALRLLDGTPVRAPRLLAADPEAEHTDVPALLVTLLPGSPPPVEPQLESFATELARALAAIHAVAIASGALPAYRPWHDVAAVRRPDWVSHTVAWDRLWGLAGQLRPPAETRLIHRDYHHGNTLWSSERLTGVVDWTTASVGSRGVDVAHARWNLALAHGPEVAGSFLRAYEAAAPDYSHDPYWDAVQIVDWLDERIVAAPLLARLDRYVTDAMP